MGLPLQKGRRPEQGDKGLNGAGAFDSSILFHRSSGESAGGRSPGVDAAPTIRLQCRAGGRVEGGHEAVNVVVLPAIQIRRCAKGRERCRHVRDLSLRSTGDGCGDGAGKGAEPVGQVGGIEDGNRKGTDATLGAPWSARKRPEGHGLRAGKEGLRARGHARGEGAHQRGSTRGLRRIRQRDRRWERRTLGRRLGRSHRSSPGKTGGSSR